MNCPTCHTAGRKFGKDRDGNQRVQCGACNKAYSDRPANPLGDMRLSLDKTLGVRQLLLEGMSARARMRVTGVNRNTILDLLVHVGDHCEMLLEDRMRGVPCRDVQGDEVWGYVFCKEKTRTRKYDGAEGVGDAYCYMGIERTTTIVLAWHLGRRSADDTRESPSPLRGTSKSRPTGSSRTRPPSPRVPERRLRQAAKDLRDKGDEHRDSPGEVNGTIETQCCGSPDPARICTSHVECGNLTVRMQDRRVTRLTNGFGKKSDNYRTSMPLHFARFNFGRTHMTLSKEAKQPTAPAMAAGLEVQPWTLRELVERSTLG